MAPRMVNRFNAECVGEHLYSLPPVAGGRPGSSAPLAHGPGQDEQDPSSVGLRQQGPLVQGDLSCGGHAEHQPLDLRGGRCCRWTYQGNLLRPGNPEGHFDMDAILDNCRHGNTTQYLIKWAVSTVSTPGKVTWSGSTVILSYPSNDAVDSCIRLFCLHSTLKWQILHALMTAPWSSHRPVTPARHCTWKTPSQTSRWSCQSSSCHMALTTE